jgi:hypothetical protein
MFKKKQTENERKRIKNELINDRIKAKIIIVHTHASLYKQYVISILIFG